MSWPVTQIVFLCAKKVALLRKNDKIEDVAAFINGYA